MTNPKRYTQPCVQTMPGEKFEVQEVELFEDPKGKWVRWEDYERLKSAYETEVLRNNRLERPGDRVSAEPAASQTDEWMPDCTCGRDPKFFRHDSQCPLRYWHELRTLRTNEGL